MNHQSNLEKIITILEDICPGVDYKTCQTLIDQQILDSFAILSIVAELQDTFDVYLTPMDIQPSNFNSAQALTALMERKKAGGK